VHATIAMIISPVSWALITIPDLFHVIASAPSQAIYLALFFGSLWGIGSIIFGVSVPYIGLSLTMGIVMGLAASAGSFIPFFQMDKDGYNPSFPYVLSGVAIMLIGVAITAKAGINKGLTLNGGTNSAGFTKGIIIAVACGLLSAFLNIGFANAASIAHLVEVSGAITRNSILAAWVVVLFGANIMNAGYAVFLLFKNNSWSSFSIFNSKKAYSWSIIAGFCWFAALGIYGQGATLMGEMDPVIGWPILLGPSLIISNIWAYKTGEWKGAEKAFKLLLIGLLILILASVVLGFANTI
jgi:L-rhamnose-H+ transport protein